MNLKQYESLQKLNFASNEEFSKFVIDELKKLDDEHKSRYEEYQLNLLYGYTVDRDSFCVNIEDNKIVVFNGKEYILPTTFQECLPNKRAYPQDTNYFFTKLCNQFGHSINFTSFH